VPDHFVATGRPFCIPGRPDLIQQHSRDLPVRRVREQVLAQAIVDVHPHRLWTEQHDRFNRTGRTSRSHADVGVQQ
jgi:hypothetical protein